MSEKPSTPREVAAKAVAIVRRLPLVFGAILALLFLGLPIYGAITSVLAGEAWYDGLFMGFALFLFCSLGLSIVYWLLVGIWSYFSEYVKVVAAGVGALRRIIRRRRTPE